jgi:hypothetical protein
MARTRKSHESGKEEVKSSGTKLKPAYAASGRDRFVVYADLQRESDPYARVLVLKFDAEYAAQHFISQLIHNDGFEWIDPIGKRKAIKTTGGVRISMFGDDLATILDYKMSEAEKAWTDEHMKQMVLRFKYGTHEAAKKDDNEERTDGTDETLGESTTKGKSKRGAARAPKEPKVKVDKSGYVSAIDIAKELKLEGREVRVALRASGMKKPDIGWMWPKDSKELKEARKAIEANLKKKAKK